MNSLEFAVDFDQETGARAYSFTGADRPYLVGFGLRTISTPSYVSEVLESAARTGVFAYGYRSSDERASWNEVEDVKLHAELACEYARALTREEQDAIADPKARSDLIDSVREEHGFGTYLIEVNAAPFNESLWQTLTLFHPARSVFRAIVGSARDEGDFFSVAYPLSPASSISFSLERGTRFGGADTESLDRFLDLVADWNTSELARDPKKASPPIFSGPSRIFEDEVGSRIFGRN